MSKELREKAFEEDVARIKHIMGLAQLGTWYEMQLIESFTNVYRDLEESIAAGKIMQDMLLNYMSAADIKKEFDRRLINVNVSLEGMDA